MNTPKTIIRHVEKFKERTSRLGEAIDDQTYRQHHITFLILARLFAQTFGLGYEDLSLTIEDLSAQGKIEEAKIGFDLLAIEEDLDEKFAAGLLLEQFP